LSRERLYEYTKKKFYIQSQTNKWLLHIPIDILWNSFKWNIYVFCFSFCSIILLPYGLTIAYFCHVWPFTSSSLWLFQHIVINHFILLFVYIYIFNSAKHLFLNTYFLLKWCKDYLNRLQYIIIETIHPLYVIFQNKNSIKIKNIDWSIFDIKIYWLWKINLQFNISLHTNVWQGHSMLFNDYYIVSYNTW